MKQRLVVGALFLLCARAPAAPLLVSKTPLPDPQVVRVGTSWSVFGTADAPFFLHGGALTPAGLRRKELTLDYGDWPHPVHHVWSFTVQPQEDGSFHAYGTLHLGDHRTVVAHFAPKTNRWPITSWRMTQVLLGDVAARDCAYYESKLLRDADGAPYLVYCRNNGRNQNVICAQRMRSAGRIDRRFEPRTILRPDGYRSEDRNEPGGLQLVEGASLSRIGGKWVLLYSVGDYARGGSYKLGVAYSDTLVPPRGRYYEKVLLEDPNRIRKNEGRRDEVAYLLQSTHPAWPNYCGASVSGPGLGSIVTIDGRPWLVFHGYRPSARNPSPDARFVWRVPLEIAISNDRPMRDWIRPVLR